MLQMISVPVPSAPEKLVFRHQGKVVYVLFETGRIYNPKKKYNVPDRKVIGQLVDPLDQSTMYPNNNYFIFFGQNEQSIEDTSRNLTEDNERSSCLKIGAQLVIQQIVSELGLKEILENRLADNTGLCLDLMSYLLINEDNAGLYYSNFAYNHPLSTDGMRIYSDSKVSCFLNSVTREQIAGILDDWNAMQGHKNRIYIYYDSSNKNSEAGDVDILEFGKAKEAKGLASFNLSLAYDETNQRPLFYEEYPESITDVSQIKHLVDKAIGYNYQSIGFILDYESFSREKINYTDQNGYSFLMMVNGHKEVVSSILDQLRGTFETNRDCRIPFNRVYGTTIEQQMFPEDSKKRYFHIFFTSKRMSYERNQIERKIEKLSTALELAKGREVKNLDKVYARYFDCFFDKNNKLIGFKEKKNVIQKDLERCGYFCIISSEKMEAGDAYRLYIERDISKKLFSTDKSFVKSKSMKLQPHQAVSTKILIEFIALIVRNRINTILKSELMSHIDSYKNFTTVSDLLQELEKIKMIRTDNGRYELDTDISVTQKIILRAFGSNEEKVKEYACKISHTLANPTKLSHVVNQDKEEDELEGGEYSSTIE